MGVGAPGGGLGLLQFETVQKDLQLTDEQKAKLKEVIKKSVADLRGQMPDTKSLRDLSRAERQAKLAKLRKKIQPQIEETRKQVEAILTPKQVERLKEIRLQIGGVAALLNSDGAKSLNLTDEQRDKLRKVMRQAGGNLRNFFQEFRGLSPEERRAKIVEMAEKLQKSHAQMMSEAKEVLTPEQREKLEKLEGKKIELKPSEAVPPVDMPGFDLPARGEKK